MESALIRKILNRLGDRPARLAFAATNTKIARAMTLRRYDKALREHQSALPSLSALDAEIVAALNRSGLYVTTLEALGVAGWADMLKAAQAVAADCSEGARQAARAGQDFVCVPPERIVENAGIFTWGLSDRVLDIAEAYIGLPVAYDGLSIIYTVADGREVATRQWHRDREDRKMLKVAVYCNDVGEGGGPFQVITRLDTTQNDANGYRYAGGAEAELVALLGADYRDDIVTCTGAAGTVIFVDTARYFHRGEPAYTQDRAAIFYSYFAQATRHPFFCARSGLNRAQLEALCETMAPRQIACTLWQDERPLWMKLVPTAPV